MRILSAAVCAIALLVIGVSPAAAGTALNQTTPISGSMLNPCTGDTVAYAGTVHVVVTSSTDAAGGAHFHFHANAHVTGVGSPSGTQYVLNTPLNHEFNAPAGGGSSETFVANVVFVSTNGAPNENLQELDHITVAPDGTITSFREELRDNCVG